ncbi:MAG: HD domain-containing protein [Oscillospiraceae bacterium]
MTFEELKKDEAIKTYIKKADEALVALGYTEHSFAHVNNVAKNARYILETLGFSSHDIELVQIAAYLHDIGNLVNRTDHSQSGAVMAFRLLDKMNMAPEDIAMIASAIGNHDEGTGVAVNHIAAALILADKTDVRRSRVRNSDIPSFDIHDRVNYSVEKSELVIDRENSTITVNLKINTEYSTVTDYFEIFLNRMIMCRKAAEKLGLRFKLSINDQQMM